jgi:hypothetical protein
MLKVKKIETVIHFRKGNLLLVGPEFSRRKTTKFDIVYLKLNLSAVVFEIKVFRNL